jgi:hypothetical protein
MSGGHFTLDELRACARGEDPALIAPVVEHCKTCKYCGDKLAVFLALDDLAVRRPGIEQIVSGKAAKVVAGVVIALAVGVALAGYQLISTDPPPDSGSALATMEPPPPESGTGLPTAEPLPSESGGRLAATRQPPPEGGARLAATQQPPPEGAEESATPPPPESLETAVGLATTEPPPAAVVRFLLGSAVPVDTGNIQGRLLAAAEALSAGEYARATSHLEGLHSERPDSGVIAGFLGISRYLSGDDTEHVAELLATGAIDQNQAVSSFSRWYLANYLLRTGEEEGARHLLTELAAFRDTPARMAVDLLVRLERGPLP